MKVSPENCNDLQCFKYFTAFIINFMILCTLLEGGGYESKQLSIPLPRGESVIEYRLSSAASYHFLEICVENELFLLKQFF